MVMYAIGQRVSFAFLDDEPSGLPPGEFSGVESGEGIILHYILEDSADPFIVVDDGQTVFCLMPQEITGLAPRSTP